MLGAEGVGELLYGLLLQLRGVPGPAQRPQVVGERGLRRQGQRMCVAQYLGGALHGVPAQFDGAFLVVGAVAGRGGVQRTAQCPGVVGAHGRGHPFERLCRQGQRLCVLAEFRAHQARVGERPQGVRMLLPDQRAVALGDLLGQFTGAAEVAVFAQERGVVRLHHEGVRVPHAQHPLAALDDIRHQRARLCGVAHAAHAQREIVLGAQGLRGVQAHHLAVQPRVQLLAREGVAVLAGQPQHPGVTGAGAEGQVVAGAQLPLPDRDHLAQQGQRFRVAPEQPQRDGEVVA